MIEIEAKAALLQHLVRKITDTFVNNIRRISFNERPQVWFPSAKWGMTSPDQMKSPGFVAIISFVSVVSFFLGLVFKSLNRSGLEVKEPALYHCISLDVNVEDVF